MVFGSSFNPAFPQQLNPYQQQTYQQGPGSWLGNANQETQLLVSNKQTQVQRELNILDGKIIDALCQVHDRNLIVALLDIRYQVYVTQKVNLAPKPKPKPPEPVTKYRYAIKCKQLGGPDPGGNNVAIPKTNAIHVIEYESDSEPNERSGVKALCGAKTSPYDWFTNPYRWKFLGDDDIDAWRPACKKCEKSLGAKAEDCYTDETTFYPEAE